MKDREPWSTMDVQLLAEAIQSITVNGTGSHVGIIRALNILSSYVVQSDARIAALEAAAPRPTKVGTWDADGQHWQCECTAPAGGWGPAWVECTTCHVRRPPFAGLRDPTDPAGARVVVIRDEVGERVEAQRAVAKGAAAEKRVIGLIENILRSEVYLYRAARAAEAHQKGERCRIEVTGCTGIATHDLGPFGASRRAIPACLSCVRAHDAEGTQYGRERGTR